MKSLSEAWDWYESVRVSLQQLQRIGSKYWTEIPWASAKIARDDDFKTLEAEDISAATRKGLAPIDDLAIVVLFSVFESLVRQHLVEQLQPEKATLSNPILIQAAENAVQGLKKVVSITGCSNH